MLTGYPEPISPYRVRPTRQPKKQKEAPSLLLFKVSPAKPPLYWSIMTADYYTGLNWLRTTNETFLEEPPHFQDPNATKVFTVELNTSLREFFLPMPPFNSTLANISKPSAESLELYVDTLGNTYKAIRHEANEVVYQVSWRSIEIDDRLISLDNVSEKVLDKYLQLPYISTEIWNLAEKLKDPSYSVLDQILADVQFIRTEFTYNTERSHDLHQRIFVYGLEYPKYSYKPAIQGSDVHSFLQTQEGICIDAATLLAIILRIQKIPARISIGYKPERSHQGRLLYYTSGAHTLTEAYLPPYGWIQFDATPPLKENPLVKVAPFKKEVAPGSKVFYQLSITNRLNSTHNFRLFVESKRGWEVKAFPQELKMEASQTVDALLEVTVPKNANFGEKDIVTITVASTSRLDIAFSTYVIVQAEEVLRAPTFTMIQAMNEEVIRGNTFWVNGTVLTADDEQVHNMTIYVLLTKNSWTESLVVGKGYSTQGNFHIKSEVPHYVNIGDYKVVTVALGTAQYHPSANESAIKMRATTRIELGPEEEFLLGYGAIHGRLLWDNGTGLADTTVTLKITSLTTPSKVFEFQNVTSKDGIFSVPIRFRSAGLHEVKATFSGNEYLLKSEETRIVEFKRGTPTIQIFSEKFAIRGEIFKINGTVMFEGIGVWGEPLTISFDNHVLATIETRDNGSYTLPLPIDPHERLGLHIVKVSLKEGNLSAVHKVLVKAKTTLTVKVYEVAGGMFLLFSASLHDDHNMSIQGAEIVLNNYGLSGKTDENGNLKLILDTVKLWPENVTLNAKFEGSTIYLPATNEREVFLEPLTSLPFLIPLVAPILVAVTFAYAKHFLKKRQEVQRLSRLGAVEKEAATTVEKDAYRFTYQPEEKQPLKIIFPDIKAPFPNVWGLKDKLCMEIMLENDLLEKTEKRKVEVFIDKKRFASSELSHQGRARLFHTFHVKGEHKVQALLSEEHRQILRGETKVRIVDYREEVIRLYNEFLKKLADYGVIAWKEMTAREIENFALRMGGFNPKVLQKITFCFEKAEYSNHLLNREDYEIMYLSLKELKINVK
jgi:hypothetical protein